jgi:hypothetical protein
MIVLLSPAKSLNLSNNLNLQSCRYNVPYFSQKSSELVNLLKNKSKLELKSLFKVSDVIAQTNYDWFQSMSSQIDMDNINDNLLQDLIKPKNYYQAGLIYDGPAFHGLDYKSLSPVAVDNANKHFRILSGLYGLLNPNDLIQPYRLEMSTKISINKNIKNLYDFWGTDIISRINEELLQQSNLNLNLNLNSNKVLINLASDEYFKVIKTSVQ